MFGKAHIFAAQVFINPRQFLKRAEMNYKPVPIRYKGSNFYNITWIKCGNFFLRKNRPSHHSEILTAALIYCSNQLQKTTFSFYKCKLLLAISQKLNPQLWHYFKRTLKIPAFKSSLRNYLSKHLCCHEENKDDDIIAKV